jgi:hypothetical protein
MNDLLTPITTTPVPMPGYDDSVIGGEWVTTRFRYISEALRQEMSPQPPCVAVRESTAHLSRRRLYYVMRPQAPVIDWATLPLRAEPGQPVTTVTGLELARYASEETVRLSFLSFFVATLKAKARGDLTRPVFLYWVGHGGGKTDITAGRWLIQIRDRLQGVLDEVWPEGLLQDAAGNLVRAASSHEARDLHADFRRLAAAWKKQKKLLSSMTAIESSPHYRGIIALGRPAVPLILDELERDPDYWFKALSTITGEDPVPAEDRGNLVRMTEHWLNWGRRTRRGG